MSSHKTIQYRSFKNFDVNKYREDLKAVPWNVMSIVDNPNDKWDTFYNIFMEVVNSHAPIKQKRVKFNQQPKWFTKELSGMMKQFLPKPTPVKSTLLNGKNIVNFVTKKKSKMCIFPRYLNKKQSKF